MEDFFNFLVINVGKAYNVLFRRIWMNKNTAIVSNYHQCVMNPLGRAHVTIAADNDLLFRLKSIIQMSGSTE